MCFLEVLNMNVKRSCNCTDKFWESYCLGVGTLKELNYYAGGNTAKGFVHFFESNFQDLDRLFILKGGPGTGKSSIIKSIGREWRDKGYAVEWINCSSDVDSLDAVIIPHLKAGIVDGTKPHIIEPKYPGVIEEYVNLGIAWNRNQLLQHKEEILSLSNRVNTGFQTAYCSFREGLANHDELEKIYIRNIDFDRAAQLTNKWIEKLLPEKSKTGNGIVKHRFLGATTPVGPVDFVENLTEDVENRYFIKGRAGSGKSTMLKQIAHAAEKQGFHVEVYHCGFDPNSLDMVIVRECQFAIFDSTAPHEYFPRREKDEIIDLYEETIQSGTDEKYAEEISFWTKKYKDKMDEGIHHLAETKKLRDKLESFYVKAMDFETVDGIRNQINEELKKLS